MSAAEPTPGPTIAHVPTTPEFPHANPSLASWTRATWLRAVVIEVIAATVAAGADAALAAPLLAVFLSAGDANGSGPGLAVVAFPLAFVMMLVMAYCAHNAGHLQNESTPKKRSLEKFFLTVWIAGGLGLTALRAMHSYIMPPSMDPALTPGTEEAQVAYNNTVTMAHLADYGQALVMLIFYFASGLLVMAQAKKLGNPQLGHMLRSDEGRRAAIREWKKSRAQALMFVGQRNSRREHIEHGLDREKNNAIDQAKKVIKETKEYSVLIQTQIDPDPTKTMMTHAHHLQIPANDLESRSSSEGQQTEGES